MSLKVHPSPVRSGALCFVLGGRITLDGRFVNFNPAPAEKLGPNYRVLPRLRPTYSSQAWPNVSFNVDLPIIETSSISLVGKGVPPFKTN